MKILVTGGAGYIGSITTAELIAAGHTVVVFDNLAQGHIEAVHPTATFVQGDLLDQAAVAALFAAHPDCDGIMHFASHTLVGESVQKPLMYFHDNLLAVIHLLEQAVAHGVRRFILSSTANLFDQPEQIPIPETGTIRPGSPYGESKYMLERILFWMDKIYGLRSICLRYFNAAGGTPERGEDHDPETHLIPLVLQVALGQREAITVFGNDYPTPDGTCIRDYIHVVDLARAHILAMEHLDRIGTRQFNVGSGRGFSVLEVIQMAERVTGKPIPYTLGARRMGDPPILVAASDQLQQELNWYPQHSDLEQIVASAWDWHQRNPHGYCG